ncbi:hypothetical protein FNF29_06542 [Cafeteria roenbergensis]|uniref:Uncharacterized protein n=1 Tax=Cafeteria roenbergensis TaxID=33653 RepID=A0A5A8C7D1_CAFRO|nr:hypothetical protein FNF29_06542 [Cafeteria roenbergensis]|eukprot:KAA0148604.1 hypothetical protein FNF29_06542 [Cafeteria roenbergensis]
MEGNPWDPLCWEDVFEATIRPASPTPGRKVRIFLIVDEFQELFKFDPLGHRFRTQLTALMNGLEDFEIFVMGTPTVGRQVLLNPGAMQDDPRIVHYPGLVGQVASVNITKISQPARLNRFSGDEAVHFLLSCLPELKESTLSDIPGIPHLPTCQAAEDASSSISGWLNDLKSATVTAKGQDARPASETSADSAVGPSEAAKSIEVQLLPSLDLKASDGGQPLPMDKFFKEKPDRFGADAIAVVELGEEDGPKTRHIIRVQVKVSSDTDEQKALSTGGVATILQQMNDSFRDDGSSEPKTSLLQSVLTSQTEGLACIVVWNCLVTCKKTSLARDSSNWLKALQSASKDVWQPPTADALSRTARADRATGLKADESKNLLGGLHPFKSEANGVPVYVVPVVADHEVMLDMWPARVKQFAPATGIRNYSKPRP